MSVIQAQDVRKLASLARISLNDEQVKLLQDQLGAILTYVEKLQMVDVDGVEPTYQVTGLENVFREDEPIDYGCTPKALLKNVPDRQADYIRVNRMI